MATEQHPGHPRQEIKPGDIIGTWRIIRRSERRNSRDNKLKYEYFYDAECIHCGFKATKRVHSMRIYESHMSCPKRRGHRREVAIKGGN